jgi:hypothetical protein
VFLSEAACLGATRGEDETNYRMVWHTPVTANVRADFRAETRRELSPQGQYLENLVNFLLDRPI